MDAFRHPTRANHALGDLLITLFGQFDNGVLRSSHSSSTTTLGESKDEEQQRLTGVYEVPTMPQKEW